MLTRAIREEMKMKKAILISVAALLAMAMPAFAEDLGSQTTAETPTIESIGFLGRGIASLPSDPTNFKVVKVGVARVKVVVNETATVVPIGILVIDGQKYRIRNLAIGNGSATGDLYLNETKVGSISVKLIIKDDTEVWAGTLTMDGTTYNLHILQAPRLIKKAELKEKIREYCNETGDGNCSGAIESYCESNPTDTRCLALFKAFCIRKNNMDDSRCRDFMKGWCKDNPEITDCRLFAVEMTKKYCEDNPKTPTCNAIEKKLVNYCETDSDQPRCKTFCEKYPDKCKNVIKNLVDFCLENANHSSCLQYCRSNPKGCVKLAAGLANACMNEPSKQECKEYCKEHPVQCRLATAELARFCIGNQSGSKCETFCRNYPNACKQVVQGIESYCSQNSDKPVCQAVCKRLGRCAAANEDKEQACADTGGTATNSSCCGSAEDYPNTCLIGACGCSPENSKETKVCECGEGKCFNGNSCVSQNQEQNQNQNQGGR